ncbi:MAG: hypothetical protein B7X90_01885 [Novosphingobium sp. 17-62-19]|uniref:exonuclease domain-containing protein n=1 Tax=Novosphingobium sp. 17-62-19 TaxID=1970406 RepID=UPI000BCB4885|nr:exonuclease domain-containing protein [Novosphingobium sp. 17-62-19]OZA21388.1 MAG: hypothetical protein B7X90_01885 [Novosphingobium sp. 17-62-19]HQS95067.1 exonuclease domain-containing protein [Novosphingobium sp.]
MIEGFVKGAITWLTGWEFKELPPSEPRSSEPAPAASPVVEVAAAEPAAVPKAQRKAKAAPPVPKVAEIASEPLVVAPAAILAEDAISEPEPAKTPRKYTKRAKPAPIVEAIEPAPEPEVVVPVVGPVVGPVVEPVAVEEPAAIVPAAQAETPKRPRKAPAKAKAGADGPAIVPDFSGIDAPPRFVALDVETANPRYHSICQIGVVLFENGREVAAEKVLVNPREEFGEWQMRVHSIRPDHVADAPCFAEHHEWLCRWTKGEIVVSHSGFDPSAIAMACGVHGVAEPDCQWIDSRDMARGAWPGLKSYTLPNLAKALNITYAAHDALEDARACGLLFLHSIAGTPIAAVAVGAGGGAEASKSGRWPGKLRRAGSGAGALLGETVVFTNDFAAGKEAVAAMAAAAGADVEDGVNKRTTMVVVGTRNALPGWQAKSNKHLKAEKMFDQGHSIRIVDVDDFMAMAATQ